MSKMSARFVGREVGKDAKWVYGMWKDMGLVEKDKFGDWILTAKGKKAGGDMSNGPKLSVPIFDFNDITKKMIRFYNKYRKGKE